MPYVQIYLKLEKEYCIIPLLMLTHIPSASYELIDSYPSEDNIFDALFPLDRISEFALLDYLFPD
jgi:hypothetical protein